MKKTFIAAGLAIVIGLSSLSPVFATKAKAFEPDLCDFAVYVIMYNGPVGTDLAQAEATLAWAYQFVQQWGCSI